MLRSQRCKPAWPCPASPATADLARTGLEEGQNRTQLLEQCPALVPRIVPDIAATVSALTHYYCQPGVTRVCLMCTCVRVSLPPFSSND